MLNMAIEAARRHNKLPVNVLIVDLEAQYNHTMQYIERMDSNKDINAYWVCLPSPAKCSEPVSVTLDLLG